jgi:transposase-like protein
VRADCLAFALRTCERDGVWGGANEVARRPLMRRVAAGEEPDAVAADYCVARADQPARPTWSEDMKAKALRLAAEVGPTVAAERLGLPYTTVRSWASNRRHAERRAASGEQARGDTGTMTDAEVEQLVERAVRTATAAVLEDLNRALAETLAELVERLDTLTATVSTSLHVLAPLDPLLAEAASSLGEAASWKPLADRIAASLADVAPWCARATYGPAVAASSRIETQLRLVMNWLDEAGAQEQGDDLTFVTVV